MIGQVIGHYRLDEVIGQGGMGSVYVAYDQHLQRNVALKLLHPHLANEPNFRNLFIQEAKTAASLRHDHIVQIFHSSSHDDEHLFIAMEWIEGGSLRQYLQTQETIDYPEIVELIRQATNALHYAHSQGVIHRDIKPENLLLDMGEFDNGVVENRRIKLTDFGLAKLEAVAHSIVEGPKGSIPYMSPEACDGLPVDGRADIYSLGIVLYECLAGKRPFNPQTLPEARQMHLNHPVPKLPAKVPSSLKALVYRCLKKAPDDRFASAYDLSVALRDVLKFDYEDTVETELEFDQPASQIEVDEKIATTPMEAVEGTPQEDVAFEMEMMGEFARIIPNPDTIAVQAGSSASTEITVTNLSQQVEHFALTIDGLPDEWFTIQAPDYVALDATTANVIRLMPKGLDPSSAKIMVQFHPPRASHSTAEQHDFSVNVARQSQPDDVISSACTLAIAPYYQFTAELTPTQLIDGRKDTQLLIQNRGNTPTAFEISVKDNADVLDFALSTDSVIDVGAGEDLTSTVTVSRQQTPCFTWREDTRPFTVTVTPADEASLPAHPFLGSYEITRGIDWQQCRWHILAVLAVLLIGIGIVFTTLRLPPELLETVTASSTLGNTDTSITFSVSMGEDSDRVNTYQWNFEGDWIEGDATISHTFEEAGVYEVLVKAVGPINESEAVKSSPIVIAPIVTVGESDEVWNYFPEGLPESNLFCPSMYAEGASVGCLISEDIESLMQDSIVPVIALYSPPISPDSSINFDVLLISGTNLEAFTWGEFFVPITSVITDWVPETLRDDLVTYSEDEEIYAISVVDEVYFAFENNSKYTDVLVSLALWYHFYPPPPLDG